MDAPSLAGIKGYWIFDMEKISKKFTLVLLTHNRRNRVKAQIDYLKEIYISDFEIIVVDNASDNRVNDLIALDERIRLIRNEQNLGAVGRNVGMKEALGEFIVTLDDDVYGLRDSDFDTLLLMFKKEPSLAAVNFKVLEEVTNQITDWCHPRDMNVYSETRFQTNHISEGAVVFRKSALNDVGFYAEKFFISHEGPDLAFRLLNAGYDVIYTPEVSVYHTYEQRGRVSWRRYYYDTRNQLWLAVRNYPLLYAMKQLFWAWGSVFVYSVRDGYVLYWFKGIVDGIKGVREVSADRQKPKKATMRKIKEIESFRPDIITRIKKRLFSDAIRG